MKKFVIDGTQFVGLQLGDDYEIVTVTTWDHDCNILPYRRAFRKNIMDIIHMNRSGRSIEETVQNTENSSDFWFIQATRPLDENQQVYRLKENMIDFDTAIDCGFGIIRVLKGKYEGEYFLYNSENDEEDTGFMLDIYLQIAVKNYDNKSLEKYVNTKYGRQLLRILQLTSDNALTHKLDMSFQRKKGGDNLVILGRKQHGSY
ncbi:hypothetical protein [Fredinandcohnia quinoae]|uniref:Uncharacterized protein n=1 Tax=Fredinandcohnia quinoae TaxID=2918902 RepID=A0AAW5E155_9BACI|nr:hypothetical protein [Fredinandcohnia sp. SECRCQ15]MCH1624454.1 hypothetical protein [Fredinandcohnia sp. SECRCQ15]